VRNVRLLAAWALGLWRIAYSDSVGENKQSSWRELVSHEEISRILQSLDVTKFANVLPQQDWGCYMDNELDRTCNHSEEVLERHTAALDPDVHHAIHRLTYFSRQTYKSTHTRRIDPDQKIPRPTNLGSHFPAAREWFDAVLYLHHWTIVKHQRLCRAGVINILPPAEF
jgi:hypothetical protein